MGLFFHFSIDTFFGQEWSDAKYKYLPPECDVAIRQNWFCQPA